ncbi:choice-of-anchor I family protein [Aphanizomenon flos-aquae]|jgi:3-phytase|uniref:Choice-of-anchor I family protein n=1 Tax=Aphanizomenon flos-aquae FACHB-1040 TaxID=2692887 RepID=A0ABR8C1K5_APHFL|nr:choice-of-anchor I family protein [Aphanizomenon flos-aquae]MBD2280737.1 choice-of-anchor I family protein [Aphanizomenon flos-aquae FACHB-1040]
MNSIQLNHIGTIKLSGAEISDFDPISQRLFVTGESANKPVLQVVDVSDANNPTQVTNIDLSSLGAGIQSVAVRKGIGTGNSIVAIAISANISTDPGKIAFYDAVTLTKISEVTVGALPDMITFTADGSKLLVTNEGEPSENYAIDPEGSISIIDVSGNIASLDNSKVTTANFTAFNGQKETLTAAGVRLFGLNATVAQDLEPEYIAVSPDGKTAFVTLQENNAFAVLDIATASITKIVPLGFKDHNLPGNGLDASDRDVNGTSSGGGKINIQNWPIFGMYQPDAISSFQIADKTYYITANEGDARIRPTANGTFGNEGSLFNEEARVSSLNLDPTAFPNATELKKPENLGRLTVTNKLGDTDGDGDFDQLYAYGARSFSIWDDQGKLVYDSGDQIEQILKQQTPTFFNANNGSATEFDTRSDNKGPEPESAIVGVINGIPYGFVGLERAGGGVMVYNLSNPTAPQFVQYIRTEGDVSPEGLKFISAENSPNFRPMLAVSNEVSNTVSFYEIASQPKLTTYEFQNLPKLGTTSTGQDILLGGFSGLYFQGVADNGNLKFVTNTDRGPNGEPTGQNRPFLLPNFQPEIVSFELNQPTNQITITKRTGLFREDGTTPLTGLPNVQAGAGGTAYTDEIGVDLNGQILPNDTLGADVEGIVIAPNGNYWLVDEYRPGIYHFDVNGKLLDRFVPQGTAAATEPDQPAGTFGTEVLPAVYAQRRANRGFEAIALEGNKLYAFIQSPIDNPDNGTDTTSRNSRNLRILEFDIVSKQVTGEYLYLLDDITGSGNAKTDKIGDAVALGNGKFAVVERDDRSDNTSNKLIYQIDLAAATNINNPANFTLPSGKTIEQLSPAELTTAGIIAANKTLIVNAAQIGYTGVEKLEGLALVAPNILAVINDNDFNVAGTTIPEKLGIIELPDYLPITISGTSGNDSLTAFTSGYTVLGLAGNDYISAVETGRGGNILDGGAGDDEIFAKENDTALGGSGNDQIFSDGQGNNILSGGEGNDQIFPDRNDKVFGDTGNDIIFSGLGGNTLTGGDGQDTFWLANAAYLQSPNIITDFNSAQDLLNVNVDGFKDINQLTLSPQGDYTLISANSNPLAILKNYELPQFAITSASATEGNIIIFTVTRTGNNSSSQSVTVTTSIATGDTASDTDLTAKTATLTFAPGETTTTFAVQTTPDVLFEGNETFTVSLSNPTNVSIISSTNATAQGTITNDDAAPIFSIATAEASEGNAINFTVTRTGDAQAQQSVTVVTSIATGDTASDTDLTAKTETLTFAQGETTKIFAVQTTPDVLFEDQETFTASLSNATNGAIISSTNATAKGTINNDDAAPIFSIAAAQALEGSAINFTLTRTGDAQANQTVTVSTSIEAQNTATASDFSGNTQTLTFAQGETTKTFTVATIQDSLVEDNETFTVSLSSPTNGAIISSTNGIALGTITDDDTPAEFRISAAEALEGNAINFTVTRSRDNLIAQSVTVATSIATDDTASANDLTAKTETLTFATGETSKTFTVQTTQDSLFEGNETFTVSLSNPNNGAVVSSTNGTAKGTINNDDAAPIFSIAAASATEGSAVNFTVTRTGDAQSNQSVTVATSIATDDTASANDLTAKTETLTFATGETSKTFTVQTTQDSLFEGNETFTVSLSNPNNGAVVSSTNATAKGTINNDDAAPIFSIAAASATEGSAVNFTVTRTGDAQANQSVTVATSIATDDTASASDLTANTQTETLTFATGETSKTFTVQTTQDSLFEGNETFTVSLSNPTNSAVISPNNGTAKGTINNDDAAPINQAPTNITLQNPITTLSEGTSTTTRLKVADIVITDDGLGSNTISLTGVDAASFEVEGTVLYIKKDTKLDYETKNSYGVTVNVDDTTVGNTPDVFTNFTLTVTDVNYAPEVKPNQIFSYTENKTANFQVGTVLATDDIAVTGFAIASGNDSGFFNINNQGIITLTDKGVTSAANDFERSPNSFTLGIIAKDAAEATSQVTNVTINVTNDPTDDNKKPNLQSFTQSGQEDQIISFGIGDFKDKGKYQDEDNNDLMAIKVVSLPTAGSLTFVNGQQVTKNQEILVNDLANLRYNPVVNANGNVATLTVAAIDNGTPKVESDPATITINLTPVNDPPVAKNDQLSVSQGSAGTINPLNNDSDPEGDSLKLTGKTDGKYGKVDINGNNLTYTLLDGNYLGNDVFSYTVSDGSLSASADVRVTVTGKATTATVAPTQLISIAPVDKLIPKEAGTLTGIVDKLGYEFPNNYNPSLVKNSLQNALNQTTAAFNNLFGLYEVDDVTGSVNGIKPGEIGYAKAALSKVVDNFIVRVGGSSSGAASDVIVNGGKIYSPFVIANGGNFSGNLQAAINAFFAANPNNSPATAQNYTTLPVAYFSFGVANPDGAAHLRSFGNNTFGFEDLPAGVGISDYDFNDAVFSFGAIA